MNLKDIQIYIFYTNTQTAHKTHKGKRMYLKTKTQLFLFVFRLFPPQFLPLTSTCGGTDHPAGYIH